MVPDTVPLPETTPAAVALPPIFGLSEDCKSIFPLAKAFPVILGKKLIVIL
ncbi:MAG: hypothetical protein ACE5GU_01220 [Candidatus Scalinduaceae bacterium]